MWEGMVEVLQSEYRVSEVLNERKRETDTSTILPCCLLDSHSLNVRIVDQRSKAVHRRS